MVTAELDQYKKRNELCHAAEESCKDDGEGMSLSLETTELGYTWLQNDDADPFQRQLRRLFR